MAAKAPRLAGPAQRDHRRVDAPQTRELRGKTERETRLYIGSLDLAAEVVAQVIRDH
jgi:hypothetical protein